MEHHDTSGDIGLDLATGCLSILFALALATVRLLNHLFSESDNAYVLLLSP